MGSVTARENIRWFIPVWLWMALVVAVALGKLPYEVVFFTFFFVFIASGVPFFCRRVGMLRLGLFGWLLPAICATVVTQLFRTLFHLS